jgi:hypothetical protein
MVDIPVPRAKTGGFRRWKENISLFVIRPINCHSESEYFLKFLLTRANFLKFNPGDVSWRFRHRDIMIEENSADGLT